MKRDTKQIGTKKVKCFGKKRPKPDLKNTKKLKTIRSQKTSSKTPTIQKHLFKKKNKKQAQKRKHFKNICSTKKQAQKRNKYQKSIFE